MKAWKRVAPAELWPWIASVCPDYGSECITVYKSGTAWPPEGGHPFKQRAIVVYREAASNGDYLIMGVAHSPQQLANEASLPYAFPRNPSWIMPAALPAADLFFWGEFTLDQASAALRRWCAGQLEPADFYNLELHRALCHVIDVHRPGLGDALEESRATLQGQLMARLLAGAGERFMLRLAGQLWPLQQLLTELPEELDDTPHYAAYAQRHGTSVPAPSLFLQASLADTTIASGCIAHLDFPGWMAGRLATERTLYFRANFKMGRLEHEQLCYLYRRLSFFFVRFS